MRTLVALLLLAGPATAWEFSPDPLCTLSHQTAQADITITFDPTLPEYALHIALRDTTWVDAQTFGMRFYGSRGGAISTSQHRLSDVDTTLSVRDTGFGNVLDGLEFNTSFDAISGERVISVPLGDAAPAVRAFRACPAPLPATS